jgi:NADPH2:quinone reductase
MGNNISGGPRQKRKVISRRGGSDVLTLMDEPMPAMLAEGRIAPVIAARMPLERAAEAHRMLDSASDRA